MNWTQLQEKAKDLSRRISRFQIAELKKQAEQGMGELAGLKLFQLGELTRLYEREREINRI